MMTMRLQNRSIISSLNNIEKRDDMKFVNDNTSGYCIYIDTICDGSRPIELDEHGYPIVYSTLLEAQRVIAEDVRERLQQFLEGTRDFDDAMTVEEYIAEVDINSDGSITDEAGNIFAKLM